VFQFQIYTCMHDLKRNYVTTKYAENYAEKPIRLSCNPYFFCQLTVFFSYNKLANNTFSYDFSDMRIQGQANSIILWAY
jgi:hypothetical protein